MSEKIYCYECGNEVMIGEQTDYNECIEYRDQRGGIICEDCHIEFSGFVDVMILPRNE